MTGEGGVNSDDCLRAADILLGARRERAPIAALPEAVRPRTLGEAYAIQDAVIQRLGGTVTGYKIGATSAAAQSFLGLDGPFYGRIPPDSILSSPAELGADDLPFVLIEPEFALTLGADLPPRSGGYDQSGVADAVASVHPAFEVVTSAYGEAWRSAGALALIADNGVHARLVLGSPYTDWRRLDLATHPVRFLKNGQEEGQGTGANALGHPLTALAWLASSAPTGLRAGQVITTGVVTPFLYAAPGDRLEADFGPLGAVRLDLPA